MKGFLIFAACVGLFTLQFVGERPRKWEKRWAVISFIAAYVALDVKSAWNWRKAKPIQQTRQIPFERLDGTIEWMEAEWNRPEDKE